MATPKVEELRTAASGPNGGEVPSGPISLAQRLRQPRTIISIVIPVIVIVAFVYLNRDTLGKVPGLVLGANPLLIAAAFVVFYAGFPLRGWRWARLLHGTGMQVSVRDSTEIIFLSWLVNCVVPAKLGDVYRAYLLKINSTASMTRTLGTVFIERILDLLVIAVLGLAAGFWSFRNGLPPSIQIVAIIGVIVVLVLAGGLLTLRNFGRSILVRLPLPERLEARIMELYDRFEEGVFGAVGTRALPVLVVVTGMVWATESLRLFLVVQALGFPGVDL
ncbi:MAG TPA: lysylphosphatidylglycerol synthase transmembrane domain-containing protein, partial [Candidatus Limnocylindrales bacterium]|nr:lysylphosphatidylglycerol synthase transmembrane domain-containing protein [Candidatus Limnocylindrales bacterium]